MPRPAIVGRRRGSARAARATRAAGRARAARARALDRAALRDGHVLDERAGLDVHRATAAEVFGAAVDQVTSEQRRYAKVINFGLIYGMSAFGLARNLGIDNTAAKNYIARYFERYPGVKQYMESTREIARRQGYVETVFGRRLQLGGIQTAKGAQLAGLERAAINAPMQGTAADLIKMIMQVHDELVFEVPEAQVDWVKTEIPRLMAGVADLKVPLLAEVGVGPNWDKAH